MSIHCLTAVVLRQRDGQDHLAGAGWGVEGITNADPQAPPSQILTQEV